jgi:biotin carboxyl carrier protein
MTRRRLLIHFGFAVVAIAMTVGLGVYIDADSKARRDAEQDSGETAKPAAKEDGTIPVRISQQARQNLGLESKKLQTTTYFRKLEVPGVVVDRPGISDRGVVAPLTGVVTKIHAYPGDKVEPDSPLCTLRLVSASLHTSQLELFKATREIELARKEKQRLEGLAEDNSVPRSRVIEIENEIQLMNVNVQAYRQDLAARGLPPDRIEAAAKGRFVTEIVVRAPDAEAQPASEMASAAAMFVDPPALPAGFELESLHVQLGQQVEAGSVLCYLADHRRLLIEGAGFKKDMALIHETAVNGLPIEVVLEDEEGADWPALPTFRIHHVANLIDPESRTFSFYLTLDNQWQSYAHEGQERWLWRFRPGDRLRLSVAVEKIENVFVLPQAAVVREGPEAYVWRQNGDLFDRIAVHVIHEDSTSMVIPNDGTLRRGSSIAQSGAASLNRVLKAQSASGQATKLHVHADGTTHEAH